MSIWGDIGKAVATGGFSLIDPKQVGSFLGGKPGGSNPTQIPGIFDRGEAQGYGRRAIDMTGQPLPDSGLFYQYLNNTNNSPYAASLKDALLNPNFSATTDAQKNLVNQAYSGRQAQFNNLGIGDSPAAQTAIAAAAAPTLEGFRQNQISDLFNANGQYNQQSNQQLNAVLNHLDEQLKQRGLDINTLMQGADLGQVRPGGQTTTNPQRGFLDYFNQTFGQGGAFGKGGALY